MAELILPEDSPLYRVFAEMASTRAMVFFAGLPGAGKSLLLQQMALMAQMAGRTVHLLQWDTTRAVFETAETLARYPEIDGVTHAAIRKAVGMWARTAVSRWHTGYGNSRHLLLGEVPLIGSRLIELVQRQDDAVEPVLGGEQAAFVVPVPSLAVRRIIEAARESTFTAPRHENEAKDAPMNVLRAIWQEVADAGSRLGLSAPESDGQVAYDPAVYAAVYQHLLQHRHHVILPVETVLRPTRSAYDLTIGGTMLAATPAEVRATLRQVEAKYTAAELETAVNNWFEL